MSAIISVVSEAFTRVVGEPPVRGAETTPADVSSWNSLAHVQLIFEIEQTLGIRLPDDILVAQTTVGALIEAAEAAASELASEPGNTAHLRTQPTSASEEDT